MGRLLVLAASLLLIGCSSNGPPIEMTIPKGFTGPIWIILDESAPELPLVDGRYRVVIPASGVLRVRSFKPFERWHAFTANYDDRTPVPGEGDSTRLSPE